MKKVIKTNKLTLKKIEISKLNNPLQIKGGGAPPTTGYHYCPIK